MELRLGWHEAEGCLPSTVQIAGSVTQRGSGCSTSGSTHQDYTHELSDIPFQHPSLAHRAAEVLLLLPEHHLGVPTLSLQHCVSNRQMQDPYHAQDPGASILSVSFVEKGFNPYCDTSGTPKPPRRLVPLRGFAVQTPLRDLSASEFLNFFPADEDGGVQHLKSHEQHPCSRAAAAATVHELTVALVAAAFMTLFKVYRQLGYYQLYIWQTTSGWPPMIGANQVAAWNSMTNTERAAMLLFMNPPTRGPADNDMETCLRVRPQGHCR